MQRRIINLDQLDYQRWTKGFPPDQQPPDGFGADVAQVGGLIGARKLGYNVTAIDPGKAAYPLHNHRANEEMFLILSGEGELRIGDERFPVRAGDVIACPPAGPESAHQLRNTSGAEPLRVFAVSTFESPDIVEYPDTGKISFGGRFTGADGKPQLVRGITRKGEGPGYWEGE